MSEQFHFPKDIPLSNPPLIEAWLEIRWHPTESNDMQYPFALGVFRERVRKEFDSVQRLEQANIPPEILPHTIRYQFHKSESRYPLIQLGPAVATINFTSPYSWEEFKNQALYLRDNLDSVYEHKLNLQRLALRYRNVLEFDYINENVFEYLESHLNFSIAPPSFIPGNVSPVPWARDMNSRYTYELKKPVGKGELKLMTVKETNSEQPLILFELGIMSVGNTKELWSSEEGFDSWLEDAHRVVHEWFFALIDGPLRDKFA
jgi:uncharacterized protein (TIGR04255 family)